MSIVAHFTIFKLILTLWPIGKHGIILKEMQQTDETFVLEASKISMSFMTSTLNLNGSFIHPNIYVYEW